MSAWGNESQEQRDMDDARRIVEPVVMLDTPDKIAIAQLANEVWRKHDWVRSAPEDILLLCSILMARRLRDCVCEGCLLSLLKGRNIMTQILNKGLGLK